MVSQNRRKMRHQDRLQSRTASAVNNNPAATTEHSSAVPNSVAVSPNAVHQTTTINPSPMIVCSDAPHQTTAIGPGVGSASNQTTINPDVENATITTTDTTTPALAKTIASSTVSTIAADKRYIYPPPPIENTGKLEDLFTTANAGRRKALLSKLETVKVIFILGTQRCESNDVPYPLLSYMSIYARELFSSGARVLTIRGNAGTKEAFDQIMSWATAVCQSHRFFNMKMSRELRDMLQLLRVGSVLAIPEIDNICLGWSQHLPYCRPNTETLPELEDLEDISHILPEGHKMFVILSNRIAWMIRQDRLPDADAYMSLIERNPRLRLAIAQINNAHAMKKEINTTPQAIQSAALAKFQNQASTRLWASLPKTQVTSAPAVTSIKQGTLSELGEGSTIDSFESTPGLAGALTSTEAVETSEDAEPKSTKASEVTSHLMEAPESRKAAIPERQSTPRKISEPVASEKASPSTGPPPRSDEAFPALPKASASPLTKLAESTRKVSAPSVVLPRPTQETMPVPKLVEEPKKSLTPVILQVPDQGAHPSLRSADQARKALVSDVPAAVGLEKTSNSQSVNHLRRVSGTTIPILLEVSANSSFQPVKPSRKVSHGSGRPSNNGATHPAASSIATSNKFGALAKDTTSTPSSPRSASQPSPSTETSSPDLPSQTALSDESPSQAPIKKKTTSKSKRKSRRSKPSVSPELLISQSLLLDEPSHIPASPGSSSRILPSQPSARSKSSSDVKASAMNGLASSSQPDSWPAPPPPSPQKPSVTRSYTAAKIVAAEALADLFNSLPQLPVGQPPVSESKDTGKKTLDPGESISMASSKTLSTDASPERLIGLSNQPSKFNWADESDE